MLVATVMVLVSFEARASEQNALGPLLERGPVVLVEDDPAGGFRQATAIVEIEAPAEVVWKTVVDMGRYKDFVPKITLSEVEPRGPTTFDVHLVYDIPGPDTDYRARMEADHPQRELKGTWLKDDLRGSTWTWRVVENGAGRTLLFHTVRVKNFSPLLQQVEDDQQTVAVGVNVSSALSTAKAIKRRSEEKLVRR